MSDKNILTPFEDSFPTEFLSQSIGHKLECAQKTAEKIYGIAVKATPFAAQFGKTLKRGCRYVVDISEETLKAIEDGVLKLTQENGNTYAQLKRNGKYSKKLPIKKEIIKNGIDPVELANALQMQALQEQLQNVTNQLNLIGGAVKEILQGQQNDRIGLYYGGLSLFLESQQVTDNKLKSNLQVQALGMLSEATFKLRMTMQREISYLEDKEYDNKKENRTESIDEHMNNINRAFAYIYQSTLIRAGIYCNISEQSAMAHVLDEFSSFIETEIAPHWDVLYQCDVNDVGGENGIWRTRSQLKLNTAELSNLLNNTPQTLYLGINKEVFEDEKIESMS